MVTVDAINEEEYKLSGHFYFIYFTIAWSTSSEEWILKYFAL